MMVRYLGRWVGVGALLFALGAIVSPTPAKVQRSPFAFSPVASHATAPLLPRSAVRGDMPHTDENNYWSVPTTP